MDGFGVSEVAVGPGWLGLCPIPGRRGDYPGDLAQLLAWSPDLVLTLTRTWEMTRAGAAGLGADLARHGIAWRHLPVPDFGLPRAAERALWPPLSRVLRDRLGTGGRVLVHCKGGCGRSGMIALRLMTEAGEAPDPALARLRAARPCAVETAAQMAWAQSAHAAPAAPAS